MGFLLYLLKQETRQKEGIKRSEIINNPSSKAAADAKKGGKEAHTDWT